MIWIITGSDKGGGTQEVAKRVYQLIDANLSEKLKLIFIKGVSMHSSRKLTNVDYLGGSGVLSALPRLYKKVIQEKPSQIISFNQEASLLLLPLCKLFKIRLISRCMNTPSMRMADKHLGYKSRILTFLYINFSHYFDKVISQCKCMKKDLINNNSRLKNKIKVIYNPVPKTNKSFNLNSFSNQHSINLLFVGRLIAQKNVKFLIEIVNSYNLKNKIKVYLDIYGEGNLKTELINYSESLNASNYINFKGYYSNDKIPYSSYEALLLTSNYEGFPNVLLEALSNNTKVIAQDIKCGPSEIILHKENGWLVKSSNISDWHLGIDWLENNKNFQEKILIPHYLSDQSIINNYKTLLNAE